MRGANRAIRRTSGFTLLEMMLVVVIIGILASVVIYNIAGAGDSAKAGATKATISQLKAALVQYYTKYNAYPTSLNALTTSSPPLITKVPTDGWNRPLVYYTPAQEHGKDFTLYSLGVDNQANTQDDINVWTMDQAPPEGG